MHMCMHGVRIPIEEYIWPVVTHRRWVPPPGVATYDRCDYRLERVVDRIPHNRRLRRHLDLRQRPVGRVP